MTFNQEIKSLVLFIRLFLILFAILFILPELIDFVLNMFVIYQPPRGSSILVSNNLYENLNFGGKFLLILKNIIISL